jgi:hypothetical protein
MFNDISRLNSWTSASSCLIVHPINTRGPGFINKLVSESYQSTLCRHMMSLLWIRPLRVEPKDAELGRFSAHHSSSSSSYPSGPSSNCGRRFVLPAFIRAQFLILIWRSLELCATEPPGQPSLHNLQPLLLALSIWNSHSRLVL